MRRRSFLTLLGGAAAAPSLLWPLAARAQQPTLPVIGFLNPISRDLLTARQRAFRQGLSETGYVEGRNVAVEHRWADGQYERLPVLAGELAARRVDVIIATSSASAQAAKAATATIPVVFVIGDDPVQYGLVASLNRPGGNLTGAISLTTEVAPKRLQLLSELIPAATVIAALINPTNPSSLARDLQAAARALGLQLHVLNASTERDFDPAFATLAQLRAGGLVIGGDSFFVDRLEQLAELTLRHAVPAIFIYREFAAAGGLMSYGGSLTDSYHTAGVYAGRILKGEKPADLPVQQQTRIELVINMKSAKALGTTFPTALLVRADEVIE